MLILILAQEQYPTSSIVIHFIKGAFGIDVNILLVLQVTFQIMYLDLLTKLIIRLIKGTSRRLNS